MNDYYCAESALPGPASAEHLTTLRKGLTVCTRETYNLNCVLKVFVHSKKQPRSFQYVFPKTVRAARSGIYRATKSEGLFTVERFCLVH